jgi:hypothetical protein
MNPIHTLQPYVPKIHVNIIPHLRLGLPSGIFLLGFPRKILYPFLMSLDIHQILQRKLEYDGTVHQLFIDFKNAYDLVRKKGGLLYNILIEMGTK